MVIEGGGLKQVKRQQVVTGYGQLPEEAGGARQRNAGEVELEVGLVALAVAGAVEDGVDVGEHILGAEGGL